MKTRNIFLMAALAGTVLAGCSNDDELTSRVPDLTDTPIRVKTGINERLNARAGYLGGEEPDYFYFSINQGAGKYSWRDVRMEKADGAWVPATLPEGELLLWARSMPDATVYAFTRGDDTAPLAATNAVPPSDAEYELALPDDQRTPEAVRQADILYCYKEGVNPADDGSISLDFDHAMSKLVISYSYGTELEGSAISLEACVISGLASKGTIRLGGPQPAIEPESGTTAAVTACVDQEAGTAEAILMPQPLAQYPTATFTVSIDGQERTFACQVKATELSPNTKYTMSVTIGRDKVDINGVGITAWEEEARTGEIETE